MKGQLLDRRYRIIQFLAMGGLGCTYLAEDTKRPGNPLCVVKQLKSHDPEISDIAKNLFVREANILENLGEHPQIPRLLAKFDENKKFYLVQEYVKGQTLEQQIKAQKTLSEQQVINLLHELLNILDFVHSQNVIHRDVKPANIIIRAEDKKPVLIDFGAVKKISLLSNQVTRIGTLGYTPEEQFRGMSNFYSDIYALGMTCIHAITGIQPSCDDLNNEFQFNENEELIWQNKIQINQKLANIFAKMVQQNWQKRYQSIKEVLQDLQQLDDFSELSNQRNNISSTTKLNNLSLLWNKTQLNFLIYIVITISAVVLILLTNKFLSKNIINYAPQLPLNNKVIHGNLNKNSQIEPLKNTYSDVYLFDSKQGQRVTVEINSKDFDPTLSILKENHQMLATNDDISPENFNSKIVVVLPENGKYQVIVRASQPGEMGKYQLKASAK